MDWLAENWFWVLVVLLFVVMHMFGHSGHGRHGGHGKQNDYEKDDQQRKKQGTDSGHRHH